MKYIIDIEKEPYLQESDPFFDSGLYRASNFKSLVFDQNGLAKLTPYTEPDRKSIEDEVWGFAKMITKEYPNWMYHDSSSYRKAKSKYEAWLKDEIKVEDEIKVGDEVTVASVTGIVLCVPKGDEERIHYMNDTGHVYCNNAYAEIVKTGRHFPEVAELLEKMRGDQDE